MGENPDQTVRNQLKKLGALVIKYLGEGKTMTFWAAVTEYQSETRILFITANKHTGFITGRYSLPMDTLPNLYEFVKTLYESRYGG